MENRVRETEILIVPYCHPDWAWTHTRYWHAERYVLAFEEALAILRLQEDAGIPADAPEAFRWYLDVFVTQLKPFLDRCPERLPELRRWITAGRIAVCGTYANVRTNHVEGETFVRSMVYGRRTFRALFPDADLSVHADLVDVAWGHPQLPQLLRQAGFRSLRGWRPHAALNAKGIPHHFRWQGLDGSEVLCSRGSYGGVYRPEYVPADYPERWSEVVRFWEEHELGEKREHAPVPLLWVQQGADDNRPLRALFGSDAPLDLVGFIQEWNRREKSRMRFATPVEAFAALALQREQLPVVEGTIDPCDVAYNAAWFGSHGLWWLRREAARALLRAETLSTLAQSFGAPYPQTDIEALWRDTLLFSCHATQWLFQEDFDELKALAEVTCWQARRIADSATAALADAVALPDDTLAMAVNPLPFDRATIVPLRITFVAGERGGVPANLQLLDGRGRHVPFQVQNELRHAGICWELEVLARLGLPAGGWNVVRWRDDGPPRPQPAKAELQPLSSVKMENELLRLEFVQGRLVRVIDKETGRVDEAGGETSFGNLRACNLDPAAPLHAGRILGHQDAEWLTAEVIETGPVRQAIRLRGRVGAHPATLEVRLPTGERRIEFAVEIDWQGLDGYLVLQVPLGFAGELWGGIPYGIERKNLVGEPYVGVERQREGMFWAQEFVDWTDGQRGLVYVPHNGDVYYIFDEAKRVLEHILINSVRRPGNNWEKDVNEGVEARGHHTFVTSIVWHSGSWRSTLPWKCAQSLTVPPVIVRRRRGEGKLPAYHSLLAVEPATVRLTAFYREGDVLLARLYESSGNATEARIKLPVAISEVSRVNLLGEALSDDMRLANPMLSANGFEMGTYLQPWEIQTIALRLTP